MVETMDRGYVLPIQAILQEDTVKLCVRVGWEGSSPLPAFWILQKHVYKRSFDNDQRSYLVISEEAVLTQSDLLPWIQEY